jgi:hypothetical protein
MNILVAYYSETGNTRKVAETIFSAIRDTRKKLLAIDQAEDLDAYDLIFCGFPVQHHSVPAKMVHFMQQLPKGKKLAIFATHGSLRGGEKAVSASMRPSAWPRGRPYSARSAAAARSNSNCSTSGWRAPSTRPGPSRRRAPTATPTPPTWRKPAPSPRPCCMRLSTSTARQKRTEIENAHARLPL